MNKPIIVLLAVATLAVGGLFAVVRSGGSARPSDRAASAEPEKHRVTAEMLAKTEAVAARGAPKFRAKGTDGVTYALDDLTGEGPLVLLFIKDGCPCSSDAQRYFNRLRDAYGRTVRFLGVIDADVDRGRAWSQANATTFPLLADPDLTIARAYGAESSAYAAVVARGGTIDHLYPGYSATMLAELADRLARLSLLPPQPIDARGAPDELSTGCPFSL